MLHFTRLAQTLIAAIALAGAALSAHAADEVKLLKANSIFSSYKGPWLRGSFDVVVANLAYAKQVSIHYRKTDGTWGNFPLSYNRPANPGKEVWTGFFSNTGGGSDMPLVADPIEFAVKYQVNGNTYWDNNGGNNYRVGHNGGTILVNSNVYNATYNATVANTNSVGGYLTVKNIAPAKQVQVHFTLDNWATVQVVNASYNPAFWNSAYSNAPNPNSYGFEEWSYQIPVGNTATTLKYALKYTVNGVTYWDNNFGNNYTTTIQR